MSSRTILWSLIVLAVAGGTSFAQAPPPPPPAVDTGSLSYRDATATFFRDRILGEGGFLRLTMRFMAVGKRPPFSGHVRAALMGRFNLGGGDDLSVQLGEGEADFTIQASGDTVTVSVDFPLAITIALVDLIHSVGGHVRGPFGGNLPAIAVHRQTYYTLRLSIGFSGNDGAGIPLGTSGPVEVDLGPGRGEVPVTEQTLN